MEKYLLKSSVCPKCGGKFRTLTTKLPKVLYCGHTLCLPCIQEIVQTQISDGKCPTCKESIHLIGGSIEDLPTNHAILDILQYYCEECVESPRSKSCGHCQKMVCDKCEELHMVKVKDGIRQQLENLVAEGHNLTTSVAGGRERLQLHVEKLKLELENTTKIIIEFIKAHQKRVRDSLDMVMKNEDLFAEKVRHRQSCADEMQMKIREFTSHVQQRFENSQNFADLQLMSAECNDQLEYIKSQCKIMESYEDVVALQKKHIKIDLDVAKVQRNRGKNKPSVTKQMKMEPTVKRKRQCPASRQSKNLTVCPTGKRPKVPKFTNNLEAKGETHPSIPKETTINYLTGEDKHQQKKAQHLVRQSSGTICDPVQQPQKGLNPFQKIQVATSKPKKVVSPTIRPLLTQSGQTPASDDQEAALGQRVIVSPTANRPPQPVRPSLSGTNPLEKAVLRLYKQHSK